MSTNHMAGVGAGKHGKLALRLDLLYKHHLLRAKRGGRPPKENVMLRGFGHSTMDDDGPRKIGYVLVSGPMLRLVLGIQQSDVREGVNRLAQRVGLKSAYRGRATGRDCYFVTKKFTKRMRWKTL